MAASGIQHSVADLVARAVTPQSVTATVKPTRRFDDMLASRRKPPHADAGESTKPKPAEAKAKPAANAKPDAKVDKTKPRAASDDAPVEETELSDEVDATDDVDAAESDDAEAVDETDAAATAEKPVKKADATAKKNPQEAGEECPPEPADAGAKPATSTLPDVASTEDEPLTVDAEVETPADETKKPAAAALSPDALAAAAALNPTPSPTANDAATTSADAAPAPAAAASTTAVAKPAPSPHAAAADAAGAPAEPVIKPHATKPTEADADLTADADFIPPDADAPAEKPATKVAEADVDPGSLLQPAAHEKPAPHNALPAVAQPDAAPQRTVAEDNVDRIVTSVRGELLTKGGSMQIRLDPPSLGAINVQISVDDGVMTASLQTNNDEATRLLSHNLQQLKTSLESTGVTVDRIQVKQAAPAESSSNTQQNHDGDRGQSGGTTQDQSARQEQQRREMLQRMWAKLSGSGDPLDLVA